MTPCCRSAPCNSEDSAASIKTFDKYCYIYFQHSPHRQVPLTSPPLQREIFVITAVKSGIYALFVQVGREVLSRRRFPRTQPFPASTVNAVWSCRETKNTCNFKGAPCLLEIQKRCIAALSQHSRVAVRKAAYRILLVRAMERVFLR
jgi:hypothetical protein